MKFAAVSWDTRRKPRVLITFDTTRHTFSSNRKTCLQVAGFLRVTERGKSWNQEFRFLSQLEKRSWNLILGDGKLWKVVVKPGTFSLHMLKQ